ncbi:MAG: PKD domain-containing protein [Bacteroidetes bacterium]|nr:PKD domain-containing protein [Bacteroidota bacterium]
MKKLLLLLVAILSTLNYYSQTNINPQTGCGPLSANLTCNTIAGAINYDWYVNGVLVTTGQNANYTFTQVGYNAVDCRVSDGSNAQMGYFYSYVNVYGFNNITSPLLNGETCLGDRAGFNINSYFPNNNYSITWDFGDGSPTVSGTNNWADHEYNTLGTYTLTANTTSSCGAQSFTYAVNVTNSAPIGNVYVQAMLDTVCPGDLIYFNHPAGSNNYLMDYGDGVSEVGTRQHSYYVPGTYIIRATFFNSCGSSATATDTVVVSNNVPIPTNSNYFSVSDSTVCPTTQVNFYPYSGFSAYAWNFGDGTSSTISTPSKTYSSVGTYPVVLEVRNGCGYTSTISRNVYVQNGLPVDPFSIGVPDSVCPSTSAICIIPDGINDQDSPQIYFNFGDGGIATAQGQREITHQYATAGTYTITANVVNGCGLAYSYTTEVVVNSQATLGANSFVAGTPLSSACPNDSIFFIVSPPDIGTIFYDFGDGATSSTPNTYVAGPDGVVYAVFKHAYQNLGNYNPTVQVTSPCGSSVTIPAGNITISTNNSLDDEAGFFFNESKYYCLNEPIEFLAYGASTYEWNFGDGTGTLVSNSSLTPVTHAYTEPGTYSINLIMRNSCGAVDTFTNEVFIPDSRVNISTSTVSSSCGQQNGKAIAIVNGNNPPYSYNWTNGDHNFLADTLTAGIYYVTITDSKGCSNFAVATVSDQQAPTISLSNVIDASCNGQASGAIDITLIGSSSPYTTIWSNGRTTEDINQLVAGPYEVIVTDANGCKSTKSILVEEPEDFDITYVSYPSLCGFSTGVIQTSIQGSSGPYNYLWSNGFTGASVSGLAVGVYSLTVVDSKGCLKEKVIPVNEQTAPIAVLDSVSTLDCNVSGGASVYISTYLGSSPYTYLWSNGATTQDITNVQPGFYYVTVRGANGCKSVLTTTIDESTPNGLNICAVTVDSLINTNKVIWEMYNRTDIESFNIYRESSQAGLYFLVGNVDADSLHEFTDPSADPSIRGWRYKISTVNACGEESAQSDLHKTIHLTLNQGLANTVNMLWDSYEGLNFNEFFIWRYTNATGWVKIDSLPSNLFSYTDLTAPNPAATPDLFYYVEGGPIVECDPTRGAINTTRSNIKSPSSVSPTGLLESKKSIEAKVFPNPANSLLNVEFKIAIGTKAIISIENMLGQRAYSFETANEKNSLDISSLSNGVYFIKIASSEGQLVQRVVISK